MKQTLRPATVEALIAALAQSNVTIQLDSGKVYDLSESPGAVFTGGLDGRLRAYAAEDGRLLWDFDTGRDFPTVNGVAARGGAIDGPGPTIAGGMVFVSSGYALFGQTPGNVLLAFGPKR